MGLLGSSDLCIHPLGFGCMSLNAKQEGAESLLLHAVDQGVNFFDTADLYDQGRNEVLVGKAFSSVRKQLYLSSKVGNEWRPDGSGWDWNPSKDYLIKAVENSLKRLKTDYLDLCLLHGGTIEDPIDEVIEAFDFLVQSGKIRYYGLSSIRPNVIRAFLDKSKMVALMLPYSILDTRAEEQIFDWLQTSNVSAILRGTTAQGHLLKGEGDSYLGYSSQEVVEIQHKLKEWANQYGGHPLSLILRFALQPEVVKGLVLGMRTPTHLQEAVTAFHSEIYKSFDWNLLKAHLHTQTFEAHRLS